MDHQVVQVVQIMRSTDHIMDHRQIHQNILRVILDLVHLLRTLLKNRKSISIHTVSQSDHQVLQVDPISDPVSRIPQMRNLRTLTIGTMITAGPDLCNQKWSPAMRFIKSQPVHFQSQITCQSTFQLVVHLKTMKQKRKRICQLSDSHTVQHWMIL